MLRIISAKDLIGKRVRNPRGEKLGRVEDVGLDVESGRMAYAVVSFGGLFGLGEKLYAIPPASIAFGDDDSLVLHVDKERLEKAPGFDRKHWPQLSDPSWIVEIYEYYGHPPFWSPSSG